VIHESKTDRRISRRIAEIGIYEAFSLAHHFQLKNEKHPISTHRAYCENTDAYQADGNNERVQIRLEMILRYYKAYFAGTLPCFLA
jgi:hypothetical protein